MTDFNAHRAEFLNIVNNAAARRRDNVFAQAQHDFLGLSIRMRIVNCFARTLALFRTSVVLGGVLLAPICFVGLSLLLPKMFGVGPTLAHIFGCAIALLVLAAAYALAKFGAQSVRNAFAQKLDDVFAAKYRGELIVGQRDDLRQIWAGIRDETAKVIRDAPLDELPFFGEFRRRRLDAAAKKIFAAFQRSS